MLQTVEKFHCLLHRLPLFFLLPTSVMQHMLHALILDSILKDLD